MIGDEKNDGRNNEKRNGLEKLNDKGQTSHLMKGQEEREDVGIWEDHVNEREREREEKLSRKERNGHGPQSEYKGILG